MFKPKDQFPLSQALMMFNVTTMNFAKTSGKFETGGRLRLLFICSVLAVMMLLAISGCATRIWNQPIEKLDPGEAYDFRARLPANADDVFVVLAFSGGGTRSAAFAYGVLEKFRDTTIVIDGQQRRLLDESPEFIKFVKTMQ